MFLWVLGALWIFHLEFAGLDGGLVFLTIPFHLFINSRCILFAYYDRLCHFMLDSMLAGDGALLGEIFP
jgi:hypothetical protein